MQHEREEMHLQSIFKQNKSIVWTTTYRVSPLFVIVLATQRLLDLRVIEKSARHGTHCVRDKLAAVQTGSVHLCPNAWVPVLYKQ